MQRDMKEWARQHGERVAARMEEMLMANAHKGGRGNWIKDDPRDLLARVRQEIDELEAALSAGASPKTVWEEAADVANMVAMVADSYEAQTPAPVESP
jgi:NTP pyrophosphatase (non-canonical NTP hydrolase)